jgi:hypothetical protein
MTQYGSRLDVSARDQSKAINIFRQQHLSRRLKEAVGPMKKSLSQKLRIQCRALVRG